MKPTYFRSVYIAALKACITPGFKAIALFSLAVTALMLGAKQLALLEPMELRVYDLMVRFRPDQGYDDRLLIIAFTEDDIQQIGRILPSDGELAQVLENLQRQRPNVIGVDLHRNVPQEPGTNQLRQQLTGSSNLIAIQKLGGDGESAIVAPPGVPPGRVGFNDLVIDPDGIIRRNLLFASAEGQIHTAFSLQLAFYYLQQSGIWARPSALHPDYMQLGSAVFLPLAPHSGGYQAVDDRGYQILLNYRSQRRVAPILNFSDVLHNRFDPALVRDRIVLIGNTAPSHKDLFYTPYSAGQHNSHQMSGVEVHAQSLSQILSAAFDQRSLMWFWSEWAERAWIVLWAVAGARIAWVVRHPLALGLSIVRLLLLLMLTSYILLLHQGWIPTFTPGLALVLSAVATVTYRGQQDHRQQEMVMTLLGQNTSPAIAHALWEARDRLIQSGKLPGQRLVATMLFTDIRNFSTFSENMSPEALLDWLNEYLEVMTQVIQDHNGIINKFTGDGLLAVFGVPVPRLHTPEIAQDACNAVNCALAMSDRLHRLNQTWLHQGRNPIQMRVGIFTGQVVVGSLGGKDRLEYGVIGDSVNTASRLESCAKERQPDDCRILIAQETLDYVQGDFEVESWGAMALKGKQQLVEVYRVIAPPSPASSTESAVTNFIKTLGSDAETNSNPGNL